MPYYADLSLSAPDWRDDREGRSRAVERLLALRSALADPDGGAPPPRDHGSLLLGTWNIREFDSEKWGPRLPESYAYIAEIVDRFDLVAIQEVREDLHALDRLRSRLGRPWQYLVSDVTAGYAGNRERLAFLYDTRKVRFLGMAGELVLEPVRVNGSVVPAAQVARTPLMAAFQVGWTRFVLTTVHIVYGKDNDGGKERADEIRQVAQFLGKRAKSASEPIHNFILLGDFNICSPDDVTMKALTEDGGFTVPPEIQTIPGSNVKQNKTYDQIAYICRPDRFEPTGAAGVFDYFDTVFHRDDADIYRPYIDDYITGRKASGHTTPQRPTDPAKAATQYEDWRTYQMSDHLPLWAQFRVDFSDDYLHRLAAQTPEPPPTDDPT